MVTHAPQPMAPTVTAVTFHLQFLISNLNGAAPPSDPPQPPASFPFRPLPRLTSLGKWGWRPRCAPHPDPFPPVLGPLLLAHSWDQLCLLNELLPILFSPVACIRLCHCLRVTKLLT